jgi:sodium/hydrogen antiporter
MLTELAILALLVSAYALVADRLDRLSVGPALVFVAVSLLLSEEVLGWISLDPVAEPIKILAEVTLTLVLFADASAIGVRALRRDVRAVALLLVIGLPLTIVLGTIAALALFPGVSLGMALLIGATLAPTDAALGQAVVTDPSVPARIRRLLNVESGLNDGIATPVVFFALALATAGPEGGSGWVGDALLDLLLGTGVGVAMGVAGGWFLLFADQRRWTSAVSRQLFVLALAAAIYLVAGAAGGNGFVAAFVGGFAFGGITRHREAGAVRFTEAQGSLLAIAVWTGFGLSLAGHVFTDLWDPAAILYAVLSLTVIRMVPVALALIRHRFDARTVLFIGWFGPRGLASIVFLIIGLEGLEQAGVAAGPFVATVTWTVLLSVVLHGLTARPLAARYGRSASALPADAPELEETPELHAARRSWTAADPV